MFSNIGRKCKTAAQVLCWIGIITSIIGGIIAIIAGSEARDGGPIIVEGIILVVFGPLVSWVSSLGLYGIGEAAENSAIAANLAAKRELELNQSNTEKDT